MKGYHVVLALTALMLAGVFCLKPPAMPEWDVDLNVPLYHASFRLVDLLDSAVFKAQPDSTVNFTLNVPFKPVTPGEALDLLSISNLSRMALSDFTFADGGRGMVRLDLCDITGMPIPDSGAKSRLGPFVNTCERQCPLDRISEAEVVSGRVRVSAANHTPLMYDSLVVESPLGRVRFGPLGAGDTEDKVIDIGGAMVWSPVPMKFTVGSPGTGLDTVQLSKRDSVAVSFQLDSLHVGSARLKITAARGQRRCQVTFGTSKPFRIDSLRLSSGVCGLVVSNEFGIPINARVEAPRLGVYSDYHLNPHQSTTIDLGLTGLAIDNRSRVNSLFDFYVIAVPEVSNDYVQLTKSDGVSVSYKTNDLKSRSIAGEFLQPVYVASRLDTMPRIGPPGMHGLRVAAAELILDLESEIGFPLEVMVEGKAWRGGVEAARLEQNVIVAPGQPGARKPTEAVIPVTSLVNAGPDYITFGYTTRIIGTGNCLEGATVTGRVVMSTPMRLAFVADTVPTPSRKVELTESQRQLREEHLVGAVAQLAVANHLPVGFTGRLVVKPDSSAERSPTTLVDSLVIPFGVGAGKCDKRGNCYADVDTALGVELDSIDLSLLNTWPLGARVYLELPTSDTVMVRTTDRMTFDALLVLRLRVKD